MKTDLQVAEIINEITGCGCFKPSQELTQYYYQLISKFPKDLAFIIELRGNQVGKRKHMLWKVVSAEFDKKFPDKKFHENTLQKKYLEFKRVITDAFKQKEINEIACNIMHMKTKCKRN